jgi:hypothetical protein
MTETQPLAGMFLFYARSPTHGTVRLPGFIIHGDHNKLALMRGHFLDFGFAGSELTRRQWNDILQRLTAEARLV